MNRMMKCVIQKLLYIFVIHFLDIKVQISSFLAD